MAADQYDKEFHWGPTCRHLGNRSGGFKREGKACHSCCLLLEANPKLL